MRMMAVEDGCHPDENVVALKATLLTILSCLTPTGEMPRRIGRWGRREAGTRTKPRTEPHTPFPWIKPKKTMNKFSMKG